MLLWQQAQGKAKPCSDIWGQRSGASMAYSETQCIPAHQSTLQGRLKGTAFASMRTSQWEGRTK